MAIDMKNGRTSCQRGVFRSQLRVGVFRLSPMNLLQGRIYVVSFSKFQRHVVNDVHLEKVAALAVSVGRGGGVGAAWLAD